MKRAEKAEKILQVLDSLYPAPAIPLRHADPYTLLVAVLLSAQTTDARVNLVTPALFERAPTPAAMAALTVPEIHGFIRTCGLAAAKAANIHRLSQLLLERHDGVVPASFAALTSALALAAAAVALTVSPGTLAVNASYAVALPPASTWKLGPKFAAWKLART